MGKTRSKKTVTKGDGRCGVMDNEEIINGMQRIMEIAMCYCYPSIPDIDASNDAKWKQKKRNQFTESEIKQDFEWAWKRAKPVEEDNDTEV